MACAVATAFHSVAETSPAGWCCFSRYRQIWLLLDTGRLFHPFISFRLGCPTRTLTMCAMGTWMRLQGGAVKVWPEPCRSEAGPSVLLVVFPRPPVTLSTLIVPLCSTEQRGHPESSICCHPHHRPLCWSNLNGLRVQIRPVLPLNIDRHKAVDRECLGAEELLGDHSSWTIKNE